MQKRNLFFQLLIGFILFSLNSCGALLHKQKKYPYIEIGQTIVNPLLSDSISQCPCKTFKFSDSLKNNTSFGLAIRLDYRYFYVADDFEYIYGTELFRGKSTSIDSIEKINVFLHDSISGNRLDISAKLLFNENYLDNSSRQYDDFPEGRAQINCYYLKDNSYRQFRSELLHGTYSDSSFADDTQLYWRKIMENRHTRFVHDRPVPAYYFNSNSRFFSDLAAYQKTYNASKLHFNGEYFDEFIFWMNESLPLKKFNEIEFIIKTQFGRIIISKHAFSTIP